MNEQSIPSNMGDTTIRVSEELADELYARKTRKESYEDVIWQLIEQAEENDTAPSTSSSEMEDSATDSDATEPPETTDIDTILAEWDPQGESRQQRLDAGRAVLEYLKEQGEATKEDIFNTVYPDHKVETQSKDSWWRTTARGSGEKDGALSLAEDAGAAEWVRTPPNTDEPHHFRWLGENDE